MIIRPAVLGLPVFYGLLFRPCDRAIRLMRLANKTGARAGARADARAERRHTQKNARRLGLHSGADGINIYVGL